MRFIIGMNLSPRWVNYLTARNIEAVHWSSIGPGDAPDGAIMAYAARHDRVVLTHDLDFGAILAANQGSKPSVVQIRADDVRPEAIGEHMIRALRQAEAELERGALLTVEPQRARLRLLPLRNR